MLGKILKFIGVIVLILVLVVGGILIYKNCSGKTKPVAEIANLSYSDVPDELKVGETYLMKITISIKTIEANDGDVRVQTNINITNAEYINGKVDSADSSETQEIPWSGSDGALGYSARVDFSIAEEVDGVVRKGITLKFKPKKAGTSKVKISFGSNVIGEEFEKEFKIVK